MVYTGSILGSDTDANVSICVHGAKGDSGMRPLIKSKNNAIKFQESQVINYWQNDPCMISSSQDPE